MATVSALNIFSFWSIVVHLHDRFKQVSLWIDVVKSKLLSLPPKVKRSPLISNIPRPLSLSGNFGPYVSKKKRYENDDLLSEVLCSRWVSVVEFHDLTLGIGKVFGQESTVVKWNYQMLSLHQVTVCQKLGIILVIKWFKNWSQQKMLFTKKVRLNWYSWIKFFLERFGWFLT